MKTISFDELRSKHNFCLGITPWKRQNFLHFVGGSSNASFMALRDFERAVERAREIDGRILCWASSAPADLAADAARAGVEVFFVEDGFIRSSGLGIKLNMPASLCFSRIGIHYDARGVSNLEAFLATHDFTDTERARGRDLSRLMRDRRITKYNLKSGNAGLRLDWPDPNAGVTRSKNLVIGQVGDDASLRYGAPGIDSNEDLLRRVRAQNPGQSIVYRPHPDVTSGLRKGAVPAPVLKELDITVSSCADLIDLINISDAVHVASSQTGIEALLMDARVVCHGLPFYSGWGLTVDTAATRGHRELSLDELIYGTFCAYPLYVNPFNGEESSAEEIIELILSGRKWPRAPRSYMIAVWWKRRLRGLKGALA